MTYAKFFQTALASEAAPYPYQERLAKEPWPDLLDIPTGMGKTAAVALSWAFKRGLRSGGQRVQADPHTPRRLVWCLPMRVLVEQTGDNLCLWLDKLGHRQRDDEAGIAIHVLMGGEERTELADWVMHPERDMILIGTQDMLLSRALNRGYAAGRARWPMEFGLLNSDCLWVFDEVQLMSTGLATSLQLDAWHRRLHLRGADGFPASTENPVAKPCRSLWMSATLARHWLHSAVDWKPHAVDAWHSRHRLSEKDFQHPRIADLFQRTHKSLDGKKAVETLAKPRGTDKVDGQAKTREYIEKLARIVVDKHAPQGLTLVILNTVERATKLYQELSGKLDGIEPLLIHSRFRPKERETWKAAFADEDRKPRLIIATQVVEAGLDISAEVMFTELAPWASLVQRFGRCARRPGESGAIHWMDVSQDEETARPYAQGELKAAKARLEKLSDAGLEALAAIKAGLDAPDGEAQAKGLFPYSPRFVPREKDLFDLFDTTPDLTGADVDIARYIRDDQEMDVHVFWREIEKTEIPGKRLRPERCELCPVAVHRFREHMGVLLGHGRIWRWRYRDGWQAMTRADQELVYPGQVFLLERSCGGYCPDKGWTGNPEDRQFRPLEKPDTTEDATAKQSANDITDDDDSPSEQLSWIRLSDHARDVWKHMGALGQALLDEPDRKINNLAARWHDRGKAHIAFVSKLEPSRLEQARAWLDGEPAAKAPDGRRAGDTDAWRRGDPKPGDPDDKRRPGFRHELASALALLETLRAAKPNHEAFAWPEGLERQDFDCPELSSGNPLVASPLAEELANLTKEEFDRLVYLVASHHGKVRMSLRASPDDARADVPEPCPPNLRQARGARDKDTLPACRLPDGEGQPAVAPEVQLDLDPMELGLSCRYGPSWRDRMQNLLERLGPFRLAYLEALLRVADWRASQEEETARQQPAKGGLGG